MQVYLAIEAGNAEISRRLMREMLVENLRLIDLAIAQHNTLAAAGAEPVWPYIRLGEVRGVFINKKRITAVRGEPVEYASTHSGRAPSMQLLTRRQNRSS